MVILEGPQGIGKTSAWKALADPWYADTSIDLESKDIFQLISRHWIIELGELDSLSKSDSTKAVSYQPPNLALRLLALADFRRFLTQGLT